MPPRTESPFARTQAFGEMDQLVTIQKEDRTASPGIAVEPIGQFYAAVDEATGRDRRSRDFTEEQRRVTFTINHMPASVVSSDCWIEWNGQHYDVVSAVPVENFMFLEITATHRRQVLNV